MHIYTGIYISVHNVYIHTYMFLQECMHVSIYYVRMFKIDMRTEKYKYVYVH